MKFAWIVALGLIGLLPMRVFAETSRTPAPMPAQCCSIDQARYFATPEIESAEREQRMDEAATFARPAPDNSAALADYLHRAESLLAQLERHDAYLYLRASRNIDDQTDADAADRVNDATDLLIAGVRAALRTLDKAAFAKDAAVNPALSRYAFLLAEAERNLLHELPKEQQAILDELADPAALNSWTLYQQTVPSRSWSTMV